MFPELWIGSIAIRTFGPLLVLAFLISIVVADRRGQRRGLGPGTMVGASAYILGCAWLGTRAIPILVDPGDTFSSLGHFARGFIFTAGAWYGGFLGGCVGIFIFCFRRSLPVTNLLDTVGPPLLLGQAMGRIACLAAGCDYGSPTDSWPLSITFHNPNALIDPDLLGVPLHPVQIYEALGSLILFGLSLIVERRFQRGGTSLEAPLRPGELFAVCVAGAAALRFNVEFFRGDVNRGLWLGERISTSQIAAIIVLLILAIVIGKRRQTRTRKTSPGS